MSASLRTIWESESSLHGAAHGEHSVFQWQERIEIQNRRLDVISRPPEGTIDPIAPSDRGRVSLFRLLTFMKFAICRDTIKHS